MATITGTTGDDSLMGTSGADDFYLGQGGIDTVNGGGGKDVFYMGGAMTAADQIAGGGGGDVLVLDGDYSAGLTFAAKTISGIEAILLTAGGDYALSGLTEANFAGGRVFGGTLGSGDDMKVDASALTSAVTMLGGAGSNKLIGGGGGDRLTGGSGRDVLVGNGGDDRFFMGGGVEKAKGGLGNDVFTLADNVDLDRSDKLNGAGGNDTLELYGPHGDMTFGEHTLKGVEDIDMRASGIFHLTLSDGNVAAGDTLRIYSTGSNGIFYFDGSHETDGAFNIHLVNNYAWLIGGAGDDTMVAGYGNQTMQGGGGADVLADGGSLSSDRFVYAATSDSTAEAPDEITQIINDDVIDLHLIDADTATSGDQAFHLVAAFSGQAGELTVIFNNARHMTLVSADTDGDGAADLVIHIDGDHHDFSNFVL